YWHRLIVRASKQRFSKLARFTAWCSESIGYVRMRCPNSMQNAGSHLPWSMAHKIVCGATCPVLTVKAAATPYQPKVFNEYQQRFRIDFSKFIAMAAIEKPVLWMAKCVSILDSITG